MSGNDESLQATARALQSQAFKYIWRKDGGREKIHQEREREGEERERESIRLEFRNKLKIENEDWV